MPVRPDAITGIICRHRTTSSPGIHEGGGMRDDRVNTIKCIFFTHLYVGGAYDLIVTPLQHYLKRPLCRGVRLHPGVRDWRAAPRQLLAVPGGRRPPARQIPE